MSRQQSGNKLKIIRIQGNEKWKTSWGSLCSGDGLSKAKYETQAEIDAVAQIVNSRFPLLFVDKCCQSFFPFLFYRCLPPKVLCLHRQQFWTGLQRKRRLWCQTDLVCGLHPCWEFCLLAGRFCYGGRGRRRHGISTSPVIFFSDGRILHAGFAPW